MKKWGLLLILLLFPILGCDNGSSSGGSGNSGLNLNGTWNGQWAANVIVWVPDPNNPDKFIQQTQPLGGPLTANLQLNGKQLTGTISSISILANQPGQFTATVSNPSGNGNIEMGALYTNQYSISFYGTYSNQQIYCRFGSASTTASGTIYEGSFTLTK